MSLRYYVLGSVAFLCIFYFSKEMRDLLYLSSLPSSPSSPSSPSWRPESLVPRHALSPDSPSPRLNSDPQQEVNEKTDLEEWIQSRLTQKGLKEMTESGHWQSEQSHSL